MSRLNRPAGTVVEFGHRAIVIRFRTPAAQFVEAVTQLSLFGAKFFYEFIVFKMSSSGALIMNGFSISKQWPAETIDCREFTQKEIIYNRSNEVNGIGRTTRNVDRFDTEGFTHTLIAAGIGCRKGALSKVGLQHYDGT